MGDYRPRTQSGRDLIRAIYGGKSRSRRAFEVLVQQILAIEAEAQFLRPRWHHDRTLPPDARHFCEDCDKQVRLLGTAENLVAGFTPSDNAQCRAFLVEVDRALGREQ